MADEADIAAAVDPPLVVASQSRSMVCKVDLCVEEELSSERYESALCSALHFVLCS